MSSRFNQKGSMIVVLLLLTTILTIFATNIIRNTVFFHDISLKRQEHEYQFRAIEALLNYGIVAAKGQFEELKGGKKQAIILDPWPPEANNGYSGSLSLQGQGQKITVSASLYRGSSTVKTLSCTLKRGKKEGSKRVSDWHQLITQEKVD